MEDNNVILKSSDNVSLSINKKAAERSKLLKGIFQDYSESSELPVPEISSKSLKKVIEYLEEYKEKEPKEIPKPLKNSNLQLVLDKWDYKFISEMQQDEVIDLVNAANYMDINSLLQLGCARLASEMIDKDVEVVRKEFGIEPDMTKEEMAEYDKYPIDD